MLLKTFFLFIVIMTNLCYSQWVDIDEVIKKEQEEKIKKRENKKILIKADSKNISDVSSTGISASLSAIKKYNEEIKRTCFKKRDKNIDVKVCHQNIAASLLAVNYLKSFIVQKIAALKTEESTSLDFDNQIQYKTLSENLKNTADLRTEKLVTKSENKLTDYGELKTTLNELKVETNDQISISSNLRFSSRFSDESVVDINDFRQSLNDRSLQANNEQYATQLIDYQQVIASLANQTIKFENESSVEGLSRNVANEKIGVAKDSLFRQQSAKFFELTQKGYFLKP